ncbi:MAG: hypothetical protein APR54_10710 [Candidatus Cloacimonas sp. SDB]|nr:MAG: hypothetical protein APR54_10710 [Candidatus Cloacimonas sp. SDB]
MALNADVFSITKGKDWEENEPKQYQSNTKSSTFTKGFGNIQKDNNVDNNIYSWNEHKQNPPAPKPPPASSYINTSLKLD